MEVQVDRLSVSILIPHYNRPDLLRRSLWLLTRQTARLEIEIIIVDDGSQESTNHLQDEFPEVRWMQARPAGSPPRSPNMAWHMAYAEAKGNFIILSQPEILVPLNGVDVMLAGHEPGRRSVPTLYLIPTPYQQNRIDGVDWRANLDELQKLPEFWSDQGHWGYTNREAPGYANHFGFTGQFRSEWDFFGFIPLTEQPGHDDRWMRAREVEAGRIPNHIALNCYHQWHPRLPIHKSWQGEQAASARIRRIRETDIGEGARWKL
jgi:hypothetical protein